MATRIKSDDIDYVKSQTNIADIVADHVALKNAGIDSLKGLCPFHDERSPSFHVRPNLGYYHCFGCGESGDVINFLQQINHLSFAEAVEFLATKLNYQLNYEEGYSQPRTGPSKTRLLEANLVAQKYFQELLFAEEAENIKTVLNDRGFDDEALKKFGVGYSLNSWESLKNVLHKQGFSEEDAIAAGLLAQGNRGSYDRFRGRIMWPIKDASGTIVGFGARKLDDASEGPKYLNTPETAVYQKSKVLYGIDHAKKAIAKNKRVVVVEGYTDVMACHLVGVTEAVATCGTAFAKDHIALLRRMMGDDASAQVIFTFDPDEAGRNAALKAFANEHLFRAQTYVVVNKDGLDPADVRRLKGDDELRRMFDKLQPLFSFALQEEIKKFDLNTVEGRVSALRDATPIIAGIRDAEVRRGYVRELASMLGVNEAEVFAALNKPAPSTSTSRPGVAPGGNVRTPTDRAKPGYRLEYDSLMVLLQLPQQVGEDLLGQAVTAHFDDPDLRVIRDALAIQMEHASSDNWIERVLEAVPTLYQPLVRELAVKAIPQRSAQQLHSYAIGVIVTLLERDLLSLKSELISRLQRITDTNSSDYRKTQEQIQMLEQARRSLRAGASLG
ncbi:MAG TPA: DNA primase [Microbacteriaceae bacterium]|nr:DNA primase [Microbacteriaceae bacterium]